MPVPWLRPCIAALLMGLCCAVAGQAMPVAGPETTAAAFSRCLADLAGQAPAHAISTAAFRRRTAGLQLDEDVLAALDRQPEFSISIWDYLSGLVDAERVADGRAGLAQWRAQLTRIEQAYGVDPATVVAVWGVESNYGRQRGRRPLLRSLATLSCAGRRQGFFRGELFASLRILERGDLDAAQLQGSWAGAFGQTQFMPSTFERVAVDFDGDGRRDLVDSPLDALASTAHYLALAGWHRGETWGLPVRLPQDYQPPVSGRRATRSLAFWRQQGLRRLDGTALPAGQQPAALLQPAGARGPTFLVFRNFNAIYGYNASISYSLAIALLSDQLRGLPAPLLTWPTDDPGTSRAERREIQQRLLARGYAIGVADGMIGDKTREAIQAEQRRYGVPADGRAGQRSLQLLRSTATGADAGAAAGSAGSVSAPPK